MSIIGPEAIPTPAGFRRVKWEEVHPGQWVYVIGVEARPSPQGVNILHPKAFGPYVVQGLHQLISQERKLLNEVGQRLLVEE